MSTGCPDFMNAQMKAILKFVAILALAVSAVGYFVARVVNSGGSGDDGVKVWFYDQSAKRLYPAPLATIPPHNGDGVRAVVVEFRGEKEKKIAYLETYSNALKKILEEIQAARKAHRRYEGEVPSRESDFMGTNTLVRRPNEEAWHTASSDEGQRLMSEWREWKGPQGQAPIISTP
jgi:hypothetical protein